MAILLMQCGLRSKDKDIGMSYRPITSAGGDQIGCAEGDSAHNLNGKLLYHLDKDGELRRFSDGKVVGSVIDQGSVLAISTNAEELFPRR